jgi:hypothetical protein
MSRKTTKAAPAITQLPGIAIEQRILNMRGHRVVLDADLAEIYGVQTRALNQAVRRNLDRFPDDFMFQLTASEKREVVTNCDHLSRLRYSPTLPRAFTEHGALMVASVLNSPRAVEISLYVVRAFVRLREMAASNRDLARKLAALESKYDAQFKTVFAAIRQLMTPSEPKRRGIGFVIDDT